jgi:benzoyl-CoA reductase/2-hydroxyglutaryl-CoA dehydratase subunit BcrC/BadD/HgdB
MDDVINNATFKTSFTDVPFKKNANSIDHYRKQLKIKVLDFLAKEYGVDTSDEAILKAIKINNEVNDIITEIGNFRKLDNPTITGYEFSVITLVSMVCPKYLIVDKLRETLEELRTREPDPDPWFKARVLVVGSEVDDTDFIKLVEDSGAFVCADRFCYGSLPGRDPIELSDDEDALTQICRQYMYRGECPRYMNTEKMDGRREYVDKLAKEYKADGIIYQQMKFCDPWAYEKMMGSHILRARYGHPVLSVDRPYAIGSSGQMRTRVQAFMESIDIKKIQKEEN